MGEPACHRHDHHGRYPDNPIARESVAEFVELMKCIYLRVADGRSELVSSSRVPAATV